jgi:hypothetical protein
MGFQQFDLETGLLTEFGATGRKIQVYAWRNDILDLSGDATHYAIVTEGPAWLGDTWMLDSGMFFALPKESWMSQGAGLVISVTGYAGLFQIGGPVEAEGRLKYIDGCSDTVLVSPPRMGDPCLNHLHIPPNTDQTAHTHPSERVGVILRGRGECRTPGGVYQLEPGMGWRIPTGCLHSFHTTDDSLDVIAWHPDSDFGPTDDNHPMINRTVIG